MELLAAIRESSAADWYDIETLVEAGGFDPIEARYIVAASPVAILSLLDEIEGPGEAR